MADANGADALRLLSREFATASGENFIDLLAREASLNNDGSTGAAELARLWSLATDQQRLDMVTRLPSLNPTYSQTLGQHLANQQALGSLASLARAGSAPTAAPDLITKWLSGELLQQVAAQQAQQQQQQGATHGGAAAGQAGASATSLGLQLVVPPLNIGGNSGAALSASSVAAALNGGRPASMGSGDIVEALAGALNPQLAAGRGQQPFSFPQLSAFPGLTPSALAALMATAANQQLAAQQQQPSAATAAAAAAMAAAMAPQPPPAAKVYQTRTSAAAKGAGPATGGPTWSSGRGSDDDDDVMDGDEETPFASFVPADDRGGSGGGEGGSYPSRNRGGRKKAPEIDWRSVQDPEERRRLRRMAKNRRTAAASRERKRAVVDALHIKVEQLERDNANMRTENLKLAAKAAASAEEAARLHELLARVGAAATSAATQPMPGQGQIPGLLQQHGLQRQQQHALGQRQSTLPPSQPKQGQQSKQEQGGEGSSGAGGDASKS